MSVPESYQLEFVASDADAAKLPSPTAPVDPADVRWLDRRGRRCEVCKIVARLVSTLLCAVILVATFVWYARPELDASGAWLWLGLPGALPSFMWDLAEFLSTSARHGRGITPKAHIGVELVLSLVAYVCGAWLAVRLGLQEAGRQERSEPLAYAVAECVFVLLTATIHLALFIRACVERRREVRRRRPRVMYIPETGQTVYVVAKPFPEPPARETETQTQQQQQQQQQQQPARAPSLPPSLDGPLRHAIQQQQELLRLETPHPERPDDSTSSPSPSPAGSSPSPIKRKPVPGVPRNLPAGDRERFLRPSMRPPPEGYVPSGEELERRRRGDAQPQLVAAGDVDIKFATSATGMTPADAGAREGKYRVDAPAAQVSSTLAGERPGRARSL
ncbi:hypothetical protein LX36DRAFT_441721 [Colletotrichum falcatum]|nr:hypothetical protein LX36DRAFT_441721 [Colletotrichum falcatum]